jgi:hypothetical protein
VVWCWSEVARWWFKVLSDGLGCLMVAQRWLDDGLR